jgi:uncharacterized protein (TIGR03118 family)
MQNYSRYVDMKMSQVLRGLWSIPVVTTLLAAQTHSLPAQFYVQTNLVSDLAGMAQVTDTNLVGAWGVTRSSTSPWWVNTTFSGLSLLFNGAGQPLPIVVAIPPTNPATATGIAFNGGTGFEVAPGIPARFIFATLNGTISGWNSTQADPTLAVLKVDNSGTAGYTGLTLASKGGGDFLYAANFLQDKIEVFDSTFTAVSLPEGAFSVKGVPSNLAVFNVQLIGESLYVTYAPTNVFAGGTGPGIGSVQVFDLDGNWLKRLQPGFWMNSPWGVALAPDNFGELSNRVLVGMFGSGVIAGFDKRNGKFSDFLRNTDKLPLIISRGLWGLGFGNGANAGATNTLYFAADFRFGGGFHGLFGTLSATGPAQNDDNDNDGKDDHDGKDGHNGKGKDGKH